MPLVPLLLSGLVFSLLSGWQQLAVVGAESEGRILDSTVACPKLEHEHVERQDMSRIRPGDIRAVMAIGDDLLTAIAAKTAVHHGDHDSSNDHHTAAAIDSAVVLEYRGINFATGADPSALSLHTLLRHYTAPAGGSRGARPVVLCPGGRLCEKHDLMSYTAPLQDGLNVALSGADSQSLGLQLRQLRRQLARLNATDDVKLLVVSIGAIDLCRHGCRADVPPGAVGSGEHFEYRIRTLLQDIESHLPNTLVSLMLLPDLSQWQRFISKHGAKGGRKRCSRDAIRIAREQCPCAVASDDEARWALAASSHDYNERILKVAASVKSSRRIGVHVSGILRDTHPHKHLPPSFVSPLDCLHYTANAQRSLAVLFWRSLFRSLPQQPQHLRPADGDLYCPDTSDYIRLFSPEHQSLPEL